MGHRPNKIDINKIIQENRQKQQLLIVESEWICKEGEALRCKIGLTLY